MSTMNYSEKIPNNVNLSEDRTLQRALEQWQPNFLDWWGDMGPEGSTDSEVYLRTAVSVDPQGWAQFGHVKMRDYRWGIFLNPGDAERKIHFGDHKGEKAWQDVPGEYRANLRRIIVTQGDTEPASVEQQRHLGLTAPSMYDLRNLYQINVEEGRHLWAMVYLLHKHFGRDGREEGEALLERRSGQEDNPRILQAFNEQTPDWLSFFMFTYFTDRDGKFQLCALAESSFDPLARTTKFMLTEEAHHMFVGESGVSRVISRTCAAMNELKTDDPAKLRAAGVIDLPTIQRYLNFHFSRDHRPVRRRREQQRRHLLQHGPEGPLRRRQAHGRPPVLKGQTYRVLNAVNGQLVEKEVPMLNALERGAARRLHQGQHGRRGALEQGDREGRHPLQAEGAAQGLPPQHRRAEQREGVARGPGAQRGGMGPAPGRMAAQRHRPRLCAGPDGPGGGAGQVRQLDCAAGDGHQPPAGGLRVRPLQLIARRQATKQGACGPLAHNGTPQGAHPWTWPSPSSSSI